MFQVKAKLLYNKRVKNNYFYLAIEAPRIAKKACPGQFVTIKINDTSRVFLRRPFSIHRATDRDVEILYEAVGRGTEILSQKKPGGQLDVLGPLGDGFALNRRTGKCRLWRHPAIRRWPANRQTIIVAGGMGVAPLLFLAEKLKKSKIQNPKSKIIVLLGTKTKSQILCEKEFKKLGCSVTISTDDGSRGFKGKVTDLLKSILRNTPYAIRNTHIYACGPRPMLKEIAIISQRYNIPAQISLEEHMACGIGACFGCAVNTKEGFKRVCKEGPIFNADEIIW